MGGYGYNMVTNSKRSKTSTKMFICTLEKTEPAVIGDIDIEQIPGYMDGCVDGVCPIRRPSFEVDNLELNLMGGFEEELIHTANKICQKGKGLLTVDEENTTKGYGDLLLTTSQLENHISGVIMNDETARESTGVDGTMSFIKSLWEKDIQCGIKIEEGLLSMTNPEGKTMTKGMDALGQRCGEYYAMGCRFA